MLAGRPRFVARLDEEFALVYDPQRKAMLPEVGAGLMAEIDWRAGATIGLSRRTRSDILGSGTLA
jgi:hypothetical protein